MNDAEEQIKIARKVMKEDQEILIKLSDKIYLQWFHPFDIFIYKKDVVYEKIIDKNYGFSFDTVNECYFYKYNWAWGFRIRILGFGFDITKTNETLIR